VSLVQKRGESLMDRKQDKTKELAKEIDLMDDMLSSFVELLEEKGKSQKKIWQEEKSEKKERLKNPRKKGFLRNGFRR
jgi:hypothetical protein